MGAPEQTTLSHGNAGILEKRVGGGQRLCCVHLPTQHSHPLQFSPDRSRDAGRLLGERPRRSSGARSQPRLYVTLGTPFASQPEFSSLWSMNTCPQRLPRGPSTKCEKALPKHYQLETPLTAATTSHLPHRRGCRAQTAAAKQWSAGLEQDKPGLYPACDISAGG